MSFSATILFSPPGGSEARCCCCACKSETSASSAGSQGGNPPASTPITVTGHGLAVQSSEQLLHIIYQRVEKAVGLAEAALGLARANNELLRCLQEEVGAEHTREMGGRKLPAHLLDLRHECVSPLSPSSVTLHVVGGGHCPPAPHCPARTLGVGLVDDYVASEGAVQRVLVPAYAKQLSPATQLAIQRATSETGPENGTKLPPPRPEDMLSAAAALDGALEESGPGGAGELRHSLGFTASPCRTRGSGQKNSRRKRDLVLSKLVHNVHNHITNDKRFNGSESIKSSWNISVVKFLLEKLKQELVTSPHNYTDKELKGACVAYFLTKRREYRNSLNPFKGLKEKEEKKLRSRRYRLFANRSSIMRHFGPEDQRLWKDVTEELMSDEEDSLNEPGVWVARPPRFRAQRLTELCYHLDANSKHGTKANRVYGPPSDRLPSAEAQLLPPELYNPNFQEEEDEGGDENGPVSPPFDQPHKTCCPDLNSFIEIKVEKDE
uniref:Regulator of thyroid function and cancer n=1 Tax=Ursus maritimus TaxID=29073 RepID=A0A452UEA1_URSMA